MHTGHTVGTPQAGAASRLYTTRPLPPRQRLRPPSGSTHSVVVEQRQRMVEGDMEDKVERDREGRRGTLPLFHVVNTTVAAAAAVATVLV